MTGKTNEGMAIAPPLHIGDIYFKNNSQTCELSFNIKYDNVTITKKKNASKGYYEFTCEIKHSDLINIRDNEQKSLDDSKVLVKNIESDKSTLIKKGEGSKIIKKTIQKVNASQTSKNMKNKLKMVASAEKTGAKTLQPSTSDINNSSSDDSDSKISDKLGKKSKALKSLNVDDQYLVIANKNLNKTGIYSLSTYEDMVKLSKKTSRYKMGPFITIQCGKNNVNLNDFIDIIERNKMNCSKNEMKTDILKIEDLFDYLNKLNRLLKYNIRFYSKPDQDNNNSIDGLANNQSTEQNEKTDVSNEKNIKVHKKKVQSQNKSKNVLNEQESIGNDIEPTNSGVDDGNIISDAKKTKLNPVKRKLFTDNTEESQSTLIDEELPLKKVKTTKKNISQAEMTRPTVISSSISENELTNTDDNVTKKPTINKFIVQDSSSTVV